MAEKLPLVYVDGGLSQLPPGDSIEGVALGTLTAGSGLVGGGDLNTGSKRFDVACVVDSTLSEGDAGELLDGINRNIPLYTDIDKALKETDVNTFIIGTATEGGVLPEGYDKAVI